VSYLLTFAIAVALPVAAQAQTTDAPANPIAVIKVEGAIDRPKDVPKVERQLEEARTGSAKAVEPPSPAELAVLRLLATDLTQREIGSELFLSMNTVKTHTRSLYGKLGVTSREEAVRQANALGLFGSADSPG